MTRIQSYFLWLLPPLRQAAAISSAMGVVSPTPEVGAMNRNSRKTLSDHITEDIYFSMETTTLPMIQSNA
jgi:beta-lactamase regulating signal transducer with metallopeptidase domain